MGGLAWEGDGRILVRPDPNLLLPVNPALHKSDSHRNLTNIVLS